jgi:hypothetical protein
LASYSRGHASPKGNIFTGSFVGPLPWTLVSQPRKSTDNFTLTGAFSGKLYTGVNGTGTTTQNITLYKNQWIHDHEALIRLGNSQLKIPAPTAMELRDRRLNAMARRSMRRKFFGWSFVW